MGKNFNALITSQKEDGTFENIIGEKSLDQLPEGDLLIRVEYSSLNYKDALSASGSPGVTRKYPHTPGIDAAGIVEESNNTNFPLGTRTIVTGFDLGMNTSGGFSEYIRVPSEWAIKCPENLTTKEAMIIGTAGLTAGLAVEIINKQFRIEGKKIIVSGSTGGVGSMGVKLLSLLGAEVTAITSKMEHQDFLKNLGAMEIIHKNQFINDTRLPLNKGIYNAGIDVVGGKILSCMIASMRYKGVITTCGNVGGAKFETTVFPFILRGNSLIGIDSAESSIKNREKIWNHFASDWKLSGLGEFSRIIGLNKIKPEIKKILDGQQTGRIILEL